VIGEPVELSSECLSTFRLYGASVVSLKKPSRALLCQDHNAVDSPGYLRECPRPRDGDRPLPGAP